MNDRKPYGPEHNENPHPTRGQGPGLLGNRLHPYERQVQGNPRSTGEKSKKVTGPRDL